MFDSTTNQRLEAFSDVQLSVNRWTFKINILLILRFLDYILSRFPFSNYRLICLVLLWRKVGMLPMATPTRDLMAAAHTMGLCHEPGRVTDYSHITIHASSTFLPTITCMCR